MESLGGLAASADALPAAARGPIQSVAAKSLPALQATVDKIMNFGGVRGVLGPVVNTILEKIKALAS